MRQRWAGWNVTGSCCLPVITGALLMASWALPAWAGDLGVVSSGGSAVDDDALGNVADAMGRPRGEVLAHRLGQPDGNWWSIGLTLVGCESRESVDLAAAVATARTQLSNLDSSDALTGLDAAVETAPCSAEPIRRPDLLVALELLAQAAQDEGKVEAARAALRRLVSSDSAYQLSTPPGSGYEDLWNEIRREIGQVEPVPVAVQHAGEVLLDGELIPAEWTLTAPLLPGPHLLQWRTADTWTGAWVTVPAGSTAGALVEQDAVAALLDKGPADTGSRAAIRTWLTAVAGEAGLEGIAVVQDGRGLRGFIVDQGRTGSWNSLLTGKRRAISPAVPPLAVGIGLAGGGAAFGVLSGWQHGEMNRLRVELEGSPHDRDEIEGLEFDGQLAADRTSAFAGTAMALGTASVVSFIVAAVQGQKVKRDNKRRADAGTGGTAR